MEDCAEVGKLTGQSLAGFSVGKVQVADEVRAGWIEGNGRGDVLVEAG